MAITVSQVEGWVVELTVMASFHNSPLLREIADALNEGAVTGRIYIYEDQIQTREKVNE